MVWHRLADDEWELRLASESNMPQLQYSSTLGSYPYYYVLPSSYCIYTLVILQ